MDENDDIHRIMPILIREICVNLCPIFAGDRQGQQQAKRGPVGQGDNIHFKAPRAGQSGN